MRHNFYRLSAAALILCGFILLLLNAQNPARAQATQGKSDPTPRKPVKVGDETLPNAYQVHERVISGGQPHGEEAFKLLKKLGVQTVISVDGAKPDVELAKKYGLRYVHLPHGYDGIAKERGQELAKVVRDLPGSVYIHCHHGKHRSPAASAVACVTAGLLEPADALAILKTAGTSENYRGLYASAQSARKVDSDKLDQLADDFPEVAEIPPLAEAMIAIEHAHDHLKAMSAAKWERLADHPDLVAAHEALLLREQYTELLRTADVKKQPAGFQELLKSAEKNAEALETSLRNRKAGGPVVTINRAMAAVNQDCASCHRRYRDVPLGEKSLKFGDAADK